MKFSIGIYSCPMDPMDSIGTTFYPLIQHERNFSKSLTNRKWTFPSESIRVQWIRWTPLERLSTPSSNMSGIFLRIHLVGLYTNRLPVFRRKARGYDWILVDSIGHCPRTGGRMGDFGKFLNGFAKIHDWSSWTLTEYNLAWKNCEIPHSVRGLYDK